MTRRIFHLSLPVADLDAAVAFYVDVLGGTRGRTTDHWVDVLLWGHQITLQLRPDEVLPPAAHGKRHFGVVLPWDLWESEVERLRLAGDFLVGGARVEAAGSDREQGKAYLRDPDHHWIEIKTYRHVEDVLGLPEEA